MIMKSWVLLLIGTILQNSRLISSSLTEETLPLDSEQEECIKELKLDRSTMARLSAEPFPPEDNIQLNDLFSCAWKKQGFQRQNGQIDYNALEKVLTNALREQAGDNSHAISLAKLMASTAMNGCRSIRGSSHGQTAVKVQNCMYRRMMQISVP